MRDQQHEGITNDRKNIKEEKSAAVPPNIDQDATGICVNCAEQRAQRVVESNDKNRGSQRLQIFWNKPHPELFARADDENRNEENDQVALKTEEIRKPLRAVYAWRVRRLH